MRALGILLFTFALPVQAYVLPLRFEAAGGQFVATGSGYRLLLDSGGNTLELTDGRRTSTITTTLRHSRRPNAPEGIDPQRAAINYYQGDNWITGVRSYARVRYRSIYPGIDLVFHGSGRELEYDFIAASGADPSNIELEISRAARLHLDQTGDLILSTGAGDARWRKPEVYQLIDGRRRTISASFSLRAHNRIGFNLGPYDPAHQLVIDPTLAYATYFGGAGNEAARAVAVDNAGNVYIAGVTTSPNLPVKSAAQSAYGGNTLSRITGDAFVAKFDAAGALVYLTYLGGSGDDFATAIAVDGAGNAWVTGGTTSTNFPVTSSGALQPRLAGTGGNGLFKLGDAFLAKIGPNGGALLYSTYFGGQLDDYGTAIALDISGNIYIAGATLSKDFPTKGAYQATYRGGGGELVFPRYGVVPYDSGDVFVAKFAASNQQLVFSTYVGGTLDDQATAIAVDAAGNVFVAGYTISTDFPTTPGAFQRANRGSDQRNNIFWNFGDAFVFKLNATGNGLIYSTLLGGTGDDFISSIAIDAAGNAYVAGATCSTDFPVTTGALQSRMKGPLSAPVADQLIGDAFVAKLNPTGAALVFATYVGGTDDDAAMALTLDPVGNILIAGFTNSQDFPLTADAAQRTFAGGGLQNRHQNFGDAFVAQLNPAGTSITYATLHGGNADDAALALALDKAGNLFVTGSTMSRNLPGHNAFQPAFGGANDVGRYQGDAFLARYSGFAASGPPVLSLSTAISSQTLPAGSQFFNTFDLRNAGPGPASNLKLSVVSVGNAVQITGATVVSGLTCSGLTCTSGSFAQDTAVSVRIAGIAQQVGVATTTVTLNWDGGTQKTAQLTTTVEPPPGSLQFGLPVSRSLSAGPPVAVAIAGQNLFVLTKNIEVYDSNLTPQTPIALPPDSKPVALLANDASLSVLDSASGMVTTYTGGDSQTYFANTNASAMALLHPGLAVIGDDGVAVFSDNGNTTFDLPDRQGKLVAIAAGQFTGAGMDDLIVADAGGNIWLVPSDGAGAYGAPLMVQSGTSAVSLATGDFNGDGNLDLAVSNNTAGTVSILLGDGAGNLSSGAAVNVGAAPQGLVAADFDGDGSLDLAVAVSGRNTVCLLRNDGAGNFQVLQYGVGSVPVAVAAGDLDGDGKPDLAVANRQSGDVSVLLKTR